MARDYEIGSAFRESVKRDAKGRQFVTTNDFRLRLEHYNHIWTLDQCNRWIKRYQPFFFEQVTERGENRVWALRNMGFIT